MIVAVKTKIIFILLIFISTLCEGQLSWSRRNTAPKYELGDIIVSPEGYYFISLSQNSGVFVSIDEGDTWTDVSDKSSLYSAFYFNKFFKLINHQVYYGICNSSCSPFKFINGKFISKMSLSEAFTNLFIDQNSKIYAINQNRIFLTDSNWMKDINKKIWESKDRIIKTGFFYQTDTNYIVTRSFNVNNPNPLIDTTSIYILNSETKSASLYSEIKRPVIKERIQVSQSGNICFLDLQLPNNQLFYANRTNPFNFQQVILDSKNSNIDVIYLGRSDDSSFYVVTNSGIYFNDGNDFSVWKRAFHISENFPSLNYFDIENKYYFKDSLTAIINYGNNCGESRAYTYNQKYKKWKPVDFNIYINNLDNLQKDGNDFLYTFSPCRNYPSFEYYHISKDDGKTWELLLINGEYVRALAINKDREAIALAGEQLYLQRGIDNWKLIQNPIPDLVSFSSLFFYSSHGILFIEAYYFDKAGYSITGFYFSENGGLNWARFTPFHQSSTANYNDHDILVTKDKWIGYSYLNDPTVSSVDLGKTWQLDSMFTECDHITKMVLLPDERILISCQLQNEFGVFVTNSKGQLELLSPFFSNKLNTINFNSTSYIFGHYDLNTSPYFSKNLGKSILELDQGINPIVGDYRYFLSSLLDENNKAYLTIQNDALYVNDSSVFTNLMDKIARSANQSFNLQQIGKNLLIDFYEEISGQNSYKYNIYNQLSQKVAQGDLTYKSTLINLENLQSGIYFFQIVNNANKSHTLKFLYVD